jgi:hypothetical protein
MIAHEPGDDVAKIDARLLALSAGKPGDLGAFVKEGHLLLADERLHAQADQPRRHRVGGLLHLDRGKAGDRHDVAVGLRVATRRQRAQGAAFLLNLGRTQLVGHGADSGEENAILGLAAEVAVRSQEQVILDPPGQMPVRGLDIALFVRLGHVDGVRGDAQVPAELEVAFVKIPARFATLERMGRRATVVGPKFMGDTAEGPQSGLHARAQRQR